MRELGYVTTNGHVAERLRRQADELDLSYAHFTGQRTWTDDQLRDALSRSTTWVDVFRLLGLSGGRSAGITIKARATRLGLKYDHLGRRGVAARGPLPFAEERSLVHLRRAAPALAAAWFLGRGHMVSYPAEPCPYDLIAEADNQLYRIQVKSATVREKGLPGWRCRL